MVVVGELCLDVFAWNKSELGCSIIGEHFIAPKDFLLVEQHQIVCHIGRGLK
jgi:hypothetical protein